MSVGTLTKRQLAFPWEGTNAEALRAWHEAAGAAVNSVRSATPSLSGMVPHWPPVAADLPAATVSTPGAMPAASAAQTVDIKGDGDITTILVEAVNDLMATATGTGGTIRISPGYSVCTAQLPMTNTGGLTPIQKSLTIQGAGAGHTGDQMASQPFPAPYGGTILDMRYAGASKILAQGSGLLTIKDLSFRDTTDGTRAFVEAGFTTLHIDNVYFYGRYLPSEATPQQAIKFWGGGFLGFNTVISRCSFNRVQGIYGLAFSNAVIVRDNMWCVGSGGAAAITLDATGDGAFITGGIYEGNLFETTEFVHPVKLLGTVKENFFNNSFYDPGNGVTLCAYYADTNAINNVIVDCHSEVSAIPLILGPSSAKQTVISAQSATQLPKGIVVVNAGASTLIDMHTPGGNYLYLGGIGSGAQYIKGFEGTMSILNAYSGGGIALGAGNRADDLTINAAGAVTIQRGVSATLPVYVNNAAAIAGGLAAGRFYRTGGDPDAVCVVHT